MWFATGIIIGLAFAAVISDIFALHTWGIILCVVLLFVACRTRNYYAIILVFCIGMILGHARGDAQHQQLAAYQVYYGKQVNLQGIVHEDVVATQDGKQRVQLSSVIIDGQSLLGNIWVEVQSKVTLKRSYKITVNGTLGEGFGVLPASMYRAQLVTIDRDVQSDLGRDTRDWFATQIRKTITEPEASLGIGYLVGQRSSLPEELDTQLQLLGLTHVVVASGYNLTILVRFTRRLFARVSKYTAFITAVVMVMGFVMMTGFSPSMSRAALVTILSLLAWYFGRSVQPLVLLSLVGMITAYINPFFVWGDLGWYLSMLSFAGVMILAPLLKHYFYGVDNQPGVVVGIIIETTSAQIVTLPLILYVFGQYSPFALFANVLVLPFIPLAMLTVFIAGCVVIIFPQMATLVHWPATVILRYMTKTVDIIAALPGAVGELSFSLAGLVFGYCFLLCLCWGLWRKTDHNFGRDNIVL